METVPTNEASSLDLNRLLLDFSNSIIRLQQAAQEKANPVLIDWADGLLKSCKEQIEALKSEALPEHEPEHSDDRAEQGSNSDKSPSTLSGLAALIAACDLEISHEPLSTSAPLPKAHAPDKTKPPGSDIMSKHSRRHKSKVKVWIRQNKVVYLPTTFIEDNFDHLSMPVSCKLTVEADGVELPGCHDITIKSVPRQGLATMYCMTAVLKFQQSFINWAVVGWTRVDSDTIKIHLQAPIDEEGHVAMPSEGKHVKRKNLSDSANDERELGGNNADEEDSKPSHRGTPRSHRAYKHSQPALMSQELDLSPANSEGEMPAAPPQFGSFPPPVFSGLFPFAGSAFLNPINFPTSTMPIAPAPSLAWQMLMGGPFGMNFPLGMNPLLMGASDPLLTMRSTEEETQGAKKKAKS